jgi:6-phosphogluconolactonase (cycloisomerase 2 family)
MRRRDFLKSLAIMSTTSAHAQNHSVRLYVGTYSSPGNGEGIYCFDMDPSTGGLTLRHVTKSDTNPGCLAIDLTRTHLYAANETQAGSISSYGIDVATGRLTHLNAVSSEGAGPTHISIHPAGKHLLVANYVGGSSTVLPILADGKLGPASDNKKHQGKLGPTHAASGPPGSFAISGHDAPHAHMIHADPSGKYILATDLGLDLIFVWKFDVATGKLLANSQASVPPGDGPRHFAFHPNGRWMYCIQEESSTIVGFDWDASTGTLKTKQTLSTLPKGFSGTDFTSEIEVSADGRFVYGANRLHDTIAWFSIGSDGTLTLAGEEWTRGDYPRSFTIDPSGSYLYSCNQRSDALTTFRVDKQTGALKFTGQYTPVGSPSMAVFAP